MRLELKIARNNVSKFLASTDRREDGAMRSALLDGAIHFAAILINNYESGQEIGVKTGRLRAETVVFPVRVTGKDIKVGVGVKKKAFYALFLYKGIPHSWEITPRKISAKAALLGRIGKRALNTPFGPRASVTHPALAAKPWLREALAEFRPELCQRLVDAAKKAVGQ